MTKNWQDNLAKDGFLFQVCCSTNLLFLNVLKPILEICSNGLTRFFNQCILLQLIEHLSECRNGLFLRGVVCLLFLASIQRHLGDPLVPIWTIKDAALAMTPTFGFPLFLCWLLL